MSFLHITKRLRIFKPYFTRGNQGFVVLVPEIGDDLPTQDPLLRENGLPEFNNMTIEKCVATIGKQAYDVEKTVQSVEETITSDQPVNIFDHILCPIERAETQLETTWGVAKTLYLGNSSLMPTKSYLVIHERARKATGAKFSSFPIYHKIKEFRNENENLSEQQTRLMNKYILEGQLNGVNLDEKKREILNEVLHKLQQEKTKFREKVELSTKQFSHTIHDYNVVREFPLDLLQSIAPNPKDPTSGPWKVTLQPHVYHRFLEYCQDEQLRWNLWQANVLKSGGYGDRFLSNSVHLEEIRQLRNRQAVLLGFQNFAEMSMNTKMAGTIDNVNSTIWNLQQQAMPQQHREIEILQEFATKNGWKGSLAAHDIPYWKRKHLINQHNLDLDRIRNYFPLPKVLSGLFQLVENLFNVRLEEHYPVDTWHEDVLFFNVIDLSKSDKKPVAGLYLDLYSREHNKICLQNASGSHIGIRNRCQLTDTIPLSALIFNFSEPKSDVPALLTFADVQNLFFKFGHALQHLLTEVEYSEIAGVSNIEWDAVEVCSNVLVHFLYHPNVIESLTSHYATQEPLPGDLIGALHDERKHLAGYQLCQELYRSALDIEFHTKKEFWLDIVKRIWPQYHTYPLCKKDSHPCSFLPIISGQWAAAYYSHVWARLLAADVYSAFYEVQNDPTAVRLVGKRFRDTYLALGGACHPSEVFRRFRGRDPCPKALLKSLGLDTLSAVP